MLSALLGDDGRGDKLLDAARGLMDAFSDLLKCAQPDGGEVSKPSEILIVDGVALT